MNGELEGTSGVGGNPSTSGFHWFVRQIPERMASDAVKRDRRMIEVPYGFLMKQVHVRVISCSTSQTLWFHSTIAIDLRPKFRTPTPGPPAVRFDALHR